MISQQEAEAWIGKPAVVVWDEDDVEISGVGGIVEGIQDGVLRLRASEDENPDSPLLNWPLADILRIEQPEGYDQVIRISDNNIFV